MTGGHDRHRSVDLRDDFDQRHGLHPPAGFLHERADLHIGALPHPVLVGELPVDDHTVPL